MTTNRARVNGGATVHALPALSSVTACGKRIRSTIRPTDEALTCSSCAELAR